MIIETASWGWPQWLLIVWAILRFSVGAATHNKPMIETHGEEKGQPKRYSAFTALLQVVTLLFLLVAGGFYK